MKAWFYQNKKLLIFFGFTTLITLVFTLIVANLIISHSNDLEFYAATNEMTDALQTIGLVGLLNVAILTFWTFLFMYIILKIIFPNRRRVKEALFYDEFKFLKELPNELRKGLDK